METNWVAIASFLSPHDMVSLALTCKRFGDKNGRDKKRSAAREVCTREVRQKTEPISLMEVAARTVLFTKATEDERNALPKHLDESWIGIYNEFLKLFRYPLQFDKLAGGGFRHISTSTHSVGEDKTRVSSMGVGYRIIGAAICSNIMRAGKHSVSFQVNDGNPSMNYGITCGIMRPTTKDITSTSLDCCHPLIHDLSRFSLKEYETLYRNNVDCCLYSTNMGFGVLRPRWKRWEESELIVMDEEQRLQKKRQNENQSFSWEGQEQTRETSFTIGCVLDLDEGTLDVFKNGRRLGTMMSGLVGEYFIVEYCCYRRRCSYNNLE